MQVRNFPHPDIPGSEAFFSIHGIPAPAAHYARLNRYQDVKVIAPAIKGVDRL
jgi:hypothetical protein